MTEPFPHLDVESLGWLDEDPAILAHVVKFLRALSELKQAEAVKALRAGDFAAARDLQVLSDALGNFNDLEQMLLDAAASGWKPGPPAPGRLRV